jgi:hypothetical protein
MSKWKPYPNLSNTHGWSEELTNRFAGKAYSLTDVLMLTPISQEGFHSL